MTLALGEDRRSSGMGDSTVREIGSGEGSKKG